MADAHWGRRSTLRASLAVEGLEVRCLMAAELARFPVGPQAAFDLGQMAASPDGSLWVTESLSGRLTRISPTGEATPFAFTSASGQPDQVEDVASGPDGNLWLTDGSTHTIDRMTPSGTVTSFSMPQPGVSPRNIAAGPDGSLWFTVAMSDAIGRITTSGQVSLFSIPSTGPWSSGAEDITPGPDGNLWFTDPMANAIGRVSTDGQATLFPIATTPGAQPMGITAGPDGNLWFTETGGGSLGKITPGGAITAYALPAGSQPSGITRGPDGNVWFTDQTGRIGKITATGVLTEYGGLGAGSQPYGITSGPGNTLWFTERGTGQVGRLDVASLPSGAGLPIAGTAGQTFSGTVAAFNAPGAVASQLSATIDWGDGSQSPGSLVASVQGGLSVVGSKTYFSGGTDTVTITITEPSGLTVAFTTEATVASPPAVPSIPALPAGGTTSRGVGVPITPTVPSRTGGSGGFVSIQQLQAIRLQAMLARLWQAALLRIQRVLAHHPLPRAAFVSVLGWRARHGR